MFGFETLPQGDDTDDEGDGGDSHDDGDGHESEVTRTSVTQCTLDTDIIIFQEAADILSSAEDYESAQDDNTNGNDDSDSNGGNGEETVDNSGNLPQEDNHTLQVILISVS